MPNPRTPGDHLFEEYCDLNGYLHERDVDWIGLFGVHSAKDPDYLIDRAGDRAIVEVKQFEKRTRKDRLLTQPGQAIRVGGWDLFGDLRRKIRDGSAQLASFALVGVPLIVALTNPLQADASLDPDDVVSALLGETKLRVDPWPGSITRTYDEDGLVVERRPDGSYVNGVPHLSAVLAVTGHSRYPRVDVYDLSGAPGFSGAPVPELMFDGDADAWFGFTDSNRFAHVPVG
jgi:hypothetical protein